MESQTMRIQTTRYTVTHLYELQADGKFFVVQWERLATGDRNDIRHKISVFNVINPGAVNESLQFIEGSITFLHQWQPTEKRSKKHLKLILSELQPTA